MSLFWIQILFYTLLSSSGTYEMLSKVQTAPSGPQLHQARSIEHREVFDPKKLWISLKSAAVPGQETQSNATQIQKKTI